jgi:hypothetical protein
MMPIDPRGMMNPMPPQMGVSAANALPPDMAQMASQGPGMPGGPPMPPMDPMMGGMMPPLPMPEMGPQKMFDVKVKRCVKSGQLKVKVLPPEDFLIDSSATTLKDGRFYGDVSRMTRSAAKLKWPKKKDIIDEAPAYTMTMDDGDEKQARNNRLWTYNEVQTDKATEEVEIYETYIQVDYDGDGVAEWRQVCMVGHVGARQMLSNEEWGDEHPYVSITPDPMPHRYRGRSLFDEAGDVQNVKTVLSRQQLNNIYLANNPMTVVNAGLIENMDKVTKPDIGGVVISNGEPNAALAHFAVPFVADKAFAVMEYWDMVLEKRTGVSRSTMALDTDALQYQTKAGVDATQSAANTKVEAYARNIAECGGLKELFSKLLKLYVQNQKSVKHIQIGGKFTPMDPRGWNANMRVTINVGLGAGSKERDLAVLGGIAQKQELIIENLRDPFNPFCNIGHYFKTLRKMVETGGLKNPEQFFSEISEEEVKKISQQQQQNPPPSEEDKKLQGQMQMKQMELQAEQGRDQNRAQLDQLQFQQKAEIEKTQAQADIATNQQKIAAEAQLAERKFQMEMAMRREEHALKLELMRSEHALKAQEMQMRMHEANQKAQLGLVAGVQKQEMANQSHEQQKEFATQSHEQGLEMKAQSNKVTDGG